MKITGLFAGKPRPFGPRKSPSSIIKSPYSLLNVTKNGALEDEQGNKKLHGGPQMALHQFAQSSYDQLRLAFPDAASDMQVGSIGENISALEMNDTNVYIGDIYQIGDVILQVGSPRAPCSKINQRYAKKKVDTFILQEGITGWYYRVIHEGTIKLNDTMSLIERNQKPFSIKDIMHMSSTLTQGGYAKSALEHAVNSKGLAPEWQDKITRQLNKR